LRPGGRPVTRTPIGLSGKRGTRQILKRCKIASSARGTRSLFRRRSPQTSCVSCAFQLFNNSDKCAPPSLSLNRRDRDGSFKKVTIYGP
jgi:hypothetical protein